MRKFSKLAFFGALTALPLMMSVQSASANVIALVVDSSGSLLQTGFDLQKQGYINSLTNLYNSNPSLFGANAIGFWQFSDTVQQVHAITQINNQSDLDSLIADITAMTFLNGNTAIGDAIVAATAAIIGFGGTGSKIIDVSTDGINNTGTNDPALASDAAGASGIIVNCLGVGGAANCDFNNGEGSDFMAASFTDFESVLTTKLTQEVGVPEPMTLTLFGFGLLGLGSLRRRRAQDRTTA